MSLASSFRNGQVITLRPCPGASFFSKRAIRLFNCSKRPCGASSIFNDCKVSGSSYEEVAWFFKMKSTPVMLESFCRILSRSLCLSLIPPRYPDILIAHSSRAAILATTPSTSAITYNRTVHSFDEVHRSIKFRSVVSWAITTTAWETSDDSSGRLASRILDKAVPLQL